MKIQVTSGTFSSHFPFFIGKHFELCALVTYEIRYRWLLCDNLNLFQQLCNEIYSKLFTSLCGKLVIFNLKSFVLFRVEMKFKIIYFDSKLHMTQWLINLLGHSIDFNVHNCTWRLQCSNNDAREFNERENNVGTPLVWHVNVWFWMPLFG